MLRRNKNKKTKADATFTLQKVPKSYEEMTPEEKWDWAQSVLGGLSPSKQSKS
jgi:hypothetical protein